MKLSDRELVFLAFKAQNPNPKSELNFESPYQLLVAVILSAQATDVSVNKVTPALFALAPNPQKMVELGLEGVKERIKTIGLFNNKAKALIESAKQLLEQHQGQVPQDRALLEKLAGVGGKTAGVVLNVAFGEPCIPVDTHVFRVANRLGLVKTKTPQTTEAALLKVVPRWARKEAHHLLILHGRYICKARTPLCAQCPVQGQCPSNLNT
ncbi:MAG: endonuclease III [Candidatus Lambdaproteobacteria bacterium RIFOXYD2_FULL_50_16]|uniref:Endonuclease III n=1 Tax=Candidatus Lambdaproteobacteria bacterium RIFOXYD2_FULL_50_16 TaxID=1817772 RepID=A0A1F6GGF9_9PROT|nr:MAG: endonuclease III [Candidatus Lambdaproteobacteria bacterium RIFOXYD2_FULL_50_16]